MGDHRASIKITFEMHGVKSECDMWINWWTDACYDLPSALKDFFRDAERRSMNAYHDMEDKIEDEARARREKLVEAARSKLTPEEWNAVKQKLPGWLNE